MKKNIVLATALSLAFLTSTVTFAQDGNKPAEKKEHKTIKEDIKEAEHKHKEKKEEHKEKKEEEKKKEEHK